MVSAPLVFSPNSKRLAYVAQTGKEYFVVFDGKEGKKFDAIGNGSIIFSPDSNHMAYGAQSENKRFVVKDGKEERQFDDIGNRSLVFSPDSKYLAYVAQSDNKQFVVVGEKAEKLYDNIMIIAMDRIVFYSSDRFHYLAVRDKSIYLVDNNIGGN